VDTDPRKQNKQLTEKEKVEKFHVLKSLMFLFRGLEASPKAL
jgi:hypothetical protein